MHRIFLAVVGVAVWVGGGALAQGTQPSGKVHKVERGVLVIPIDAEAVLEPAEPQEVRIRPKAYAGELVVVSAAQAGAKVKKGQVVLELDPANITRELEAAANDLALARANFKKAQEDARLGELADRVALEGATREVENARQNLKWFDEVDGPNALKGGAIQVKDFKDRMEDQNDELDQLRKMYKTDDLTTATADIVIKRAVRALERSKEQLPLVEDMARKTKDLANPQARSGLEIAVKKAQIAMDQLQAAQEQGKVARESAVTTAKLALAKAEQKSSELRGDREALSVAAASDGMVYYGSLVGGQWQNANPRALRAGEKVAAQQVLMTIVPPGKMSAVLVVPENKMPLVVPGDRARIVLRALPSAREGVVSAISPVAVTRGSATGYEVRVEIAGPDEMMMAGMTAHVTLPAGRVEGVKLVPANCVKEGKVMVRAGGKDEERAVTVGRSDGKKVEVVAGVEEGEEVVER